jgi:hypothetical protein
MAGKPGMTGKNLGGARPGAGRKPRSITLRLDDEIMIGETHPDGSTPLESARVVKIERGKLILSVSGKYIITITKSTAPR